MKIKTKQRLMMIAGLVLYLTDQSLHICIAILYGINEDFSSLGIALSLIILPYIIVNITASFEDKKIYFAPVVIVRYAKAIKSLNNSHVYSLEQLRYLQTITQSAPQWCLQGYIMLRQWNFPWYIIVSMLFSLLSLLWSITFLEKAKRKAKDEDNMRHPILFLMWQLCTLISRLFAIVLFIYVFKYYVLIFIVIHWHLHVAVIFKADTREEYHVMESLRLSLTFFPSLFHALVTVLTTETPKTEVFIWYIITVLETVTMVILSLMVEMPGVSHMKELKPIVFGLMIGGLFTANICFLYCWESPDDDNDELDNDNDHYDININIDNDDDDDEEDNDNRYKGDIIVIIKKHSLKARVTYRVCILRLMVYWFQYTDILVRYFNILVF